MNAAENPLPKGKSFEEYFISHNETEHSIKNDEFLNSNEDEIIESMFI